MEKLYEITRVHIKVSVSKDFPEANVSLSTGHCSHKVSKKLTAT